MSGVAMLRANAFPCSGEKSAIIRLMAAASLMVNRSRHLTPDYLADFAFALYP